MNGVSPAPAAYRLATAALSPLFAAHSAWTGLRFKEPDFLPERLGYPRTPKSSIPPVWLHAASVGEVMTAWPLIQRLRQHALPVLISTNTVTAARIVRARAADGVTHVYLPWDWPSAVRRFLDHHQPRLALIVETEIWPNLFVGCRTKGVPLVMINARLSHRTLSAPAFLKAAYAAALDNVSAILARSENDRMSFIALGAAAEKITVCGNLKWADGEAVTAPQNLIGRAYWLAASTHEDEEQRISRLWLKQVTRDRLLVIAPRHPQRGHSIEKQLRSLSPRCAIRSRGDLITADTEIYLADTLGELAALIAHADWVFIGGSLVTRGGHNVLEAARLGKATLVGPHMDNFRSETDTLISAGGLLMVHNEAELEDQLTALSTNVQMRETLGTHARDCVRSQQGVLLHYLDRLEPFIRREALGSDG